MCCRAVFACEFIKLLLCVLTEKGEASALLPPNNAVSEPAPSKTHSVILLTYFWSIVPLFSLVLGLHSSLLRFTSWE